VPRDAFGRVAHALGREGIEFELERFNRAFEVRSGDPRFAHALIDAPMIEWLLGLPEGTGFEILGRTVLAIVPRPTFDVARVALGTLDAFLARVPPVVASLSRDRPRR
jgi:hypothetical protein